ncbi:Rid family hydrolase [Streptomyces sp. GbtcB6]|uniref:Rid family hydrolase n=1 Tax=Streptomyces sp. GbtcB6 TaxID=2824751 RepID=UPI0020C5EC17|nr:Rid family hydrolase [Streptomyces sp. GbtcB6]
MSKAIDVAYVRYQVTDVGKAEKFLNDFGLTTVERSTTELFLRGSGPAPFLYQAVLGTEPRFLGAGLRVESAGDLAHLSTLDGSGPVEPTGAPGGGERVRMRMPDGFEIDAVHGADVRPEWTESPPGFNAASRKERVDRSVRVRTAVAPVVRLGHFVLHVTDLDAAVGWLTERFALLASDHLAGPDGASIAGSFLRVDRGETAVDHHCMLVLGTDEPAVHHCSFEVAGLDAVMTGHDHLLEAGYQLDCGVGRHLLGSQIFDYWRLPYRALHRRRPGHRQARPERVRGQRGGHHAMGREASPGVLPMTIRHIISPRVSEPPPRLWSNCLRAGDTVYVSGLTARDRELAATGGGEYEQARVIFERMADLLAAAGGSLDDVVKLTLYVTDITRREEVWRARAEVFDGVFPAAALVEVSALAEPEIKVEIDAIAVLGQGGRP